MATGTVVGGERPCNDHRTSVACRAGGNGVTRPGPPGRLVRSQCQPWPSCRPRTACAHRARQSPRPPAGTGEPERPAWRLVEPARPRRQSWSLPHTRLRRLPFTSARWRTPHDWGLPIAILTWWSIVTPLIAACALLLGGIAVGRRESPRLADIRGPTPIA